MHGVVSCFVLKGTKPKGNGDAKGCEQIDWEELSVADFRSRALPESTQANLEWGRNAIIRFGSAQVPGIDLETLPSMPAETMIRRLIGFFTGVRKEKTVVDLNKSCRNRIENIKSLKPINLVTMSSTNSLI